MAFNPAEPQINLQPGPEYDYRLPATLANRITWEFIEEEAQIDASVEGQRMWCISIHPTNANKGWLEDGSRYKKSSRWGLTFNVFIAIAAFKAQSFVWGAKLTPILGLPLSAVEYPEIRRWYSALGQGWWDAGEWVEFGGLEVTENLLRVLTVPRIWIELQPMLTREAVLRLNVLGQYPDGALDNIDPDREVILETIAREDGRPYLPSDAGDPLENGLPVRSDRGSSAFGASSQFSGSSRFRSVSESIGESEHEGSPESNHSDGPADG